MALASISASPVRRRHRRRRRRRHRTAVEQPVYSREVASCAVRRVLEAHRLLIIAVTARAAAAQRVAREVRVGERGEGGASKRPSVESLIAASCHAAYCAGRAGRTCPPARWRGGCGTRGCASPCSCARRGEQLVLLRVHRLVLAALSLVDARTSSARLFLHVEVPEAMAEEEVRWRWWRHGGAASPAHVLDGERVRVAALVDAAAILRSSSRYRSLCSRTSRS